MAASAVLARARRRAGLSQHELAVRAQTSRTAVSAYEHGRKSPSVSTFERLLDASGFEVDLRPRLTFRSVEGRRGELFAVPDRLPRLGPEEALATVELPIRLKWSQPGRRFRMFDRSGRARVYEIVLREGLPEDVCTYIDGALLVDLWPDLVLPRHLRAAWSPLVDPVAAKAP